ncbi:NADP-dependent oxidoreductase [Paraburkholderia guartelaensis]|uniref:NADP-dependent oxidoreductase n=1 Tax=Paraburkholderia guartelaensis TaxID=2546446 RepID=UPI002AB65726|nr:NADP-dependent oxidoreductase [Paraburkholderia guartelaensis]
MKNRNWILSNRPQGAIKSGDLTREDGDIPVPRDGEILVRVLYLAMDPAIRGFMNASGNYAASLPLGTPVRGVMLGQVVRAGPGADLSEGQFVWGFGTWSDYVVAPATQFYVVEADADSDLASFTHARGTIGLTAYYGLLDVGDFKSGDTVLVSGAAGAVGSLVGQIAKIKGASLVVGIAGGPAKCQRAVDHYGYDLCIDYRSHSDLNSELGKIFPEGIDLVFENVGGSIFEASLNHLARNARIAICGMISGYNTSNVEPGPSNLWNLVVKTAQVRGFLVSSILGDRARTRAMLKSINEWISEGLLKYDIDIREGFEVVPDVYNCLFTGAHKGRLIVKVADPVR